jgi:hypothetical protein
MILSEQTKSILKKSSSRTKNINSDVEKRIAALQRLKNSGFYFGDDFKFNRVEANAR